MRNPFRTTAGLLAGSLTLTVLMSPSAQAVGEGGTRGESDGQDIKASVTQSQIRITQKGGGGGKGQKGNLAPISTDWEPPVCWYEPIFTPEQLKQAVEDRRIDHVGIHEMWSNAIFVDHYEEGEANDNFDDENSTAPGYKNYNLGEDGYFWRSVAPDDSHPDSWQCGRIMFWQDAGQIPNIPHTPTPETLAGYAYDKIRVPDTEVDMAPAAGGKQTVNLPTWMWLDKNTFQEVEVTATLPHTNLSATTTAKPVSLNLEPGTGDAELFPASGTCPVNGDGSIGTPYKKGSANESPSCGVKYLRSTPGDKPYELKASITWEISWNGSDGSGDTFPNGTFETTQDINVQEIQAINR